MKQPMTRGRFAAGTAATFATIGIIAAPAKAAQFEYKFANNISADHPLHVRAIEMWRAVDKETSGRLKVQTFGNNTLGGDTAMLTQLRAGAIQFFTLDGGILQSVVPVAAIQGVGFAFKNDQDAFAALDGALGDYVRKEIEAKGLTVFDRMWANGMRQITSSTHPIKTADDLANFKIRTPPGALWVDLFKSLGASPTAINFSEVYTSLQTHVVDGQENPYAIIDTGKLYEVQKYLSVTNHMWSAFHMLGNQEAWKALPSDIQSVVARNNAKYAVLQRRDVEVRNNSLAEKLSRRGMISNKADTSGFRPRLGGFYKKWHGEFGDTAWTLLEKRSGRLA